MKFTSTFLKRAIIGLIVLSFSIFAQAQKKETITVISIDTKGITSTNELMASMVSLELEKLDTFEVLDKYDVTNILKKNQIDPNNCFGKSQLLEAGRLLKVDRILSGSVEKFGDKIIMILRMINVKEGSIEKVNVMEYIDLESEIQTMLQLSINNIMELDNEQVVVDILSNINMPITIANSKVNLSGPRFGLYYTTGNNGEILRGEKEGGGFKMLDVNTMFGYQHEVQFVSAGEFQALFEFIGAVNGIESGYFIPSLSTLMGARFNKIGLEVGFGPVFRIAKTARGYYDQNNDWQLASKFDGDISTISTVRRLDSRGEYNLSTGLIVAAGVTIKSGYLNLPINLYWMPGRTSDGHVFGVNFGFNIAKRPKLNK